MEFALILTPLLILITGIIFFGFVLNAQVTVSQAARTGARYLAICSTDTTCISGFKAKTADAGWGLTIDPANITDIADCTTASTATVKVTFTVNLSIPIMFPNGLTVTGQASTPCGG